MISAVIPAAVGSLIGGVWLAIRAYRNRARVSVRLLNEDFYGSQPPKITFELENRGLVPTSVTPAVKMTGLLPRPNRGRPTERHSAQQELVALVKYRLHFVIESDDRQLPPHKPVRMTAVDDIERQWNLRIA
jgi:hypothetical protein